MLRSLSRRSVAVAAVVALVASSAAVLALAPAATAVPPASTASAAVCGTSTCTATFTSTRSVESFVVPADITSVRATLRGAAGGAGLYTGSGGAGDTLSATLDVSPGDTLSVAAGQAGSSGDTAGTFGGGGPVFAGAYGGSGGGGSFLSDASGLLLVAGGGGGASYQAAGGTGGGTTGGTGGNLNNPGGYHYTGATGGTQTAGGAGGTYALGFPSNVKAVAANGSGPATGPGAPGQGGHGGGNVSGHEYGGGGGGGGGYYGGGGGAFYQGGGGGSGFVSPLAHAVSDEPGSNAGPGSVTLGYAARPTTTTLTTDEQAPADSDAVTLTATTTATTGSPVGSVTFTDDGHAIDGCKDVPVGPTGVATCVTTFAAKTHTLEALFGNSPTFGTSSGSTSLAVTTAPSITTTAVAEATFGGSYEQTLAASGGSGSYTFAVVTGALPSGLTLRTATDGTTSIAGTPRATGTFPFTLQVSDGTHAGRRQFSLVVKRAAQTAEFTFAPVDPVVGGSYAIEPTVNSYTATAPACSVEANTVHFVHVGDCTIRSTRSADADHDEATTEHTVTVAKGGQVLLGSSDPIGTGRVGGTGTVTFVGGRSVAPVVVAPDADTTLGACSITAQESRVVSGAQRTVAFLDFGRVGSCVLSASQAGDDDYLDAAPQRVSIEIAGKPTTTTLRLTPANAVHNQFTTATATVLGASEGTVSFAVDGRTFDRQPLTSTGGASGGTATSVDVSTRPIITRGPSGLDPLDVGSHAVTATFEPDDEDTYSGSTVATASALTVTPSKSRVAVSVTKNALVARVSVDAPSRDEPAGSIAFTVNSTVVGSAEIVDGVARLAYSLPSGAKGVSATYRASGDQAGNVGPSSGSTARRNPTLTATASSSKGATRYGWYSRPVVVRWRCAPGSGPVAACPAPVTVSRNGVTTVTRTVRSDDGGIATTSKIVKLDRTAPKLRIAGVVKGRTYPGALPRVRCATGDPVSGIASCRVTRTANATSATYRARAVDRAGNVRTATVTVRRSPVGVLGAEVRGGRPVVRTGKVYTIVYTGKGKPRFVYAAPYPARPKGDGGAFMRTGKRQWSYGVVFTASMRHRGVWSFGVKVGKKVHVVTVRVVR